MSGGGVWLLAVMSVATTVGRLPCQGRAETTGGATQTAGDVLTATEGGAGQAAGGATDTADNVSGALQGLTEETRDVHLVYSGVGDSLVGSCRFTSPRLAHDIRA